MSSYRTGIGINLGPMALVADLSTVVPSTKNTSMKMVCPDHKSFVHQEYVCDEGEHPVIYQEALRGVPTATGIRIADPRELPNLQVEKAESLSFVGVPKESIDSNTIPSGQMYYVSPAKKGGNNDMWNVLHQLTTDENLAFVAQGALRKGRARIYKLTLFQDYLILQAVEFPDNIREAPPIPTSKESAETLKTWEDAARSFATATAVQWDKFDATDAYEKNLTSFIESGELIEQSGDELSDESSAAAQIAQLQAMVKELEGSK